MARCSVPKNLTHVIRVSGLLATRNFVAADDGDTDLDGARLDYAQMHRGVLALEVRPRALEAS